MADLESRARRFVQTRFGGAHAAYLGGSSVTGAATRTSDLDILVVLPVEWGDAAFVETSVHEGQLVEAFVYGSSGLQEWLDKGRAGRRPVLDRLIAEGRPLIDSPLSSDLSSRSADVLSAGPAPAEESELEPRRYALSAVVDDLADAAGTGEGFAIASTAWREAAELALLLDRHWLGTGKWLARELCSSGDRFGLAAWSARAFEGPDSCGALHALCRGVLVASGGYLQAGYVRGRRPPDL